MKDFSGIDNEQKETGTDREAAYNMAERSATQRGRQPELTEEELKERLATGRTQGRKGTGGLQKHRNIIFYPDNDAFIQILAHSTGRTLTRTINDIIESYRNEHPELLEKYALGMELNKMLDNARKDTKGKARNQ